MSLLIPLLIGILSVILPGFFLALALLKKTGMHIFEIAVIGVIFGFIFPPTTIWLESFLIPYIHFFTYSNTLYDINIVILTIIGIALSIQQGAISTSSLNSLFSGAGWGKISIKQETERDYKKRLANIRETISQLNTDLRIVREHERQEQDLVNRHRREMESVNIGAEERKKMEEAHLQQEQKLYEEHEAEERALIKGSTPEAEVQKSPGLSYIWIILLILMVITFATRMLSIGTAPIYFEFDPYFDMISTQSILVHGYQLLYAHAAWPSLVNGTIERLQPIVPYLEAYWYNLAATPATLNATTVNTTLLSLVSSWYVPIAGALLVFVVFMFLYHEYGEFEGLVGAALVTAMPILVTTFIAGEQLVEPWGIFALFFFYASYVLAVHNPKEPRYAILAGIAFASNFLGAHYYTVPAGILAFYIVLQGIISVMRNHDTKDFFKMNIIVLAVIVIFFIPYNAYGATLTERTPAILGVPVIVSFPVLALLFVAIFEYVPKIAKERKVIIAQHTNLDWKLYGMWLIVIAILALLLILFTPLGKPFQAYIALSEKFTTPSSPLFMTVQEYAPTGINYDFGSGGFGLIGSSIAGLSIFVWAVLIVFTALEILAIYNRNSTSSIVAVAAVWPLAVAGMIEVKYLPHFGVAYIIAIGAILGELAIYYSNRKDDTVKKALFGIGILVILIEAAPVGYQLLTAASNPNCNSIANSNNQLGAVLYCNTVPGYWLNATAWMKANVGPYGPRILSWWDYGDWINWFGNSNAVIRGDNSVATEDYDVAAHYVLTSQEGVNTSDLQSFMDSIQAKYILFDNQLVPKWGALDFLACVDINQTSEQYALAQGAQYGQPYVLGTSACEIKHDPAYLFIPISQNINNYCQLPGNSSLVALRGFVVVGQTATNETYCVPVSSINNGSTTYLLNNNGTRTNAILTPAFYGGEQSIQGTPYINFMLLYAPNGPNGTITDAPSDFYNSTYYKGFFLGRLPGFTLVYPSNFTGINYVNSTVNLVIFASNDFTGSLPYVTPKPSYVHNNYTMPG